MDESGFSLVPPVQRTWARRGQTPSLRHRYSWSKLSAISGVTLDQRLFLRLVRGTFNSDEIIVFLHVLLRHIKGAIILIWDNLSSHRSVAVREWLESHPRIHVEPLPAYAPELNADEGVWQYLKSHIVANFCPNTLEELEGQIHCGARKIRRSPELLSAFV